MYPRPHYTVCVCMSVFDDFLALCGIFAAATTTSARHQHNGLVIYFVRKS